jgi:hypothetical protein
MTRRTPDGQNTDPYLERVDLVTLATQRETDRP